jgi:hypothetical protein
MTKEYRGVIHIHSKHSFDGTLTLPQLAALSKEKRIDFLVLTDHGDSDYFNTEKMETLIEECKKVSNEEFIIIPGLEFMCEDMHILAIGIKEYFAEQKLEKLIDRIHQLGGLAILGHISYYAQIPYERLKNLDGVEVWNPRYDSRFSPSRKSLRALEKFKKQNDKILAFTGLDLHEKQSWCNITSTVRADELQSEQIIKSLREGKFYSSNGFIKFNPTNDPSRVKKIIFIVTNAAYQIGNKLKRQGTKILYRAGIKHPN